MSFQGINLGHKFKYILLKGNWLTTIAEGKWGARQCYPPLGMLLSIRVASAVPWPPRKYLAANCRHSRDNCTFKFHLCPSRPGCHPLIPLLLKAGFGTAVPSILSPPKIIWQGKLTPRGHVQDPCSILGPPLTSAFSPRVPSLLLYQLQGGPQGELPSNFKWESLTFDT